MDQIPNMFGKTPNGTEPDKLAVFAKYVPFTYSSIEGNYCGPL